MKYLLDTNAISEFISRTPNLRVIERIDALDPDSLYLSVLTLGELRKGIEKLPDSRRKSALQVWWEADLLVRFEGHILYLDVDAMVTWARMTTQLERVGKPIPAVDSLIAALALHHNCSLITRNERDFEAVGVPLINPWK